MPLLDVIIGQDGKNLTRLAKGLDLEPEATTAVLRAVVPELSHNMERETLSRGGLAQIIQHLGNPAQRDFLNDEVELDSAEAVQHGNQLLGTILRTKYQSRALADRAESETGVPAYKIRKMLPRIANVSMGALQQQATPSLEDIFKKIPSLSGNRSTNPTSPNTGHSPLPIPGDNWGGKDRNGYDDLSDVLRRRQRPLQSHPLWSIARQILGSILGFKSKGILGYIIRFIVYRYGWSVVRMIFGRLFRF